jgi:hypothetical protein
VDVPSTSRRDADSKRPPVDVLSTSRRTASPSSMAADWSLGNFLSYNDHWAQDYGNKLRALRDHWRPRLVRRAHGGAHEQHHAPVQTLQGPQPRPRRWCIATPCSTANTCANLGEIGVRPARGTCSGFASARVPKRSTSKQRVWRNRRGTTVNLVLPLDRQGDPPAADAHHPG